MCDKCQRAQAVLDRGAWFPSARDHAKRIIEQCARRQALRRARSGQITRNVEQLRRSRRASDIVKGVGCLLILVALAFAAANVELWL